PRLDGDSELRREVGRAAAGGGGACIAALDRPLAQQSHEQRVGAGPAPERFRVEVAAEPGDRAQAVCLPHHERQVGGRRTVEHVDDAVESARGGEQRHLQPSRGRPGGEATGPGIG
ncbi:MAG: hypothetical protein ACK559_13360, partial [bacterium]